MEIRKLATPEEYLEAEQLQHAVWNFPDREIIPLNELVVMQKHGGHVFGGFDGPKMASFCYGCPAFKDGKPYHYSRLLGVLPAYQDSGLGHSMKLKQREYVLAQKLDLVAWTYDPLLSRNAYLNIEKLGCIVREYQVNLFPASGSRFNQGLESDRFTAQWWIASKRTKDRIAGRRPTYDLEAHAPALETRVSEAGWREPVGTRTTLRSKRLSVEIPDDLPALMKDDLPLAQRWRDRTRGVFEAYFAKGYVVYGFTSIPEIGRRRSFYLLEKGFPLR
jgi:predicted GNAT superfamily acetyltransferase